MFAYVYMYLSPSCFRNEMAWKMLVSMVTVCVMVNFAVCKPVDKRGPPNIDPVEGGSKQEEDGVRIFFNCTILSGFA